MFILSSLLLHLLDFHNNQQIPTSLKEHHHKEWANRVRLRECDIFSFYINEYDTIVFWCSLRT